MGKGDMYGKGKKGFITPSDKGFVTPSDKGNMTPIAKGEPLGLQKGLGKDFFLGGKQGLDNHDGKGKAKNKDEMFMSLPTKLAHSKSNPGSPNEGLLPPVAGGKSGAVTPAGKGAQPHRVSLKGGKVELVAGKNGQYQVMKGKDAAPQQPTRPAFVAGGGPGYPPMTSDEYPQIGKGLEKGPIMKGPKGDLSGKKGLLIGKGGPLAPPAAPAGKPGTMSPRVAADKAGKGAKY